MTKREKYENFIKSIPAELSNKIDADAQDNAFNSPAINDNDDRFDCALSTAKMMFDDPKAFGF